MDAPFKFKVQGTSFMYANCTSPMPTKWIPTHVSAYGMLSLTTNMAASLWNNFAEK